MILPHDAQGRRKIAEYTVGIGFRFFTGCVLRHDLMVASAIAKVSYLVELVSRFVVKKLNSKKSGDDDSMRLWVRDLERLMPFPPERADDV